MMRGGDILARGREEGIKREEEKEAYVTKGRGMYQEEEEEEEGNE